MSLELGGCRPEPLGSYLKGLAVLRLVAEQAAGDGSAQGRWTEADSFSLTSRLDRESLVRFFLDAYEPTPLVAPWNGGSGFDGRDAGIADIEASTMDRLEPYRATIRAARRILLDHPGDGKEGKRALLEACRGELPDQAVEWIDAAAVLTGGDPVYPALLGTGGNIGRLELSNNFMQRLGDVLCLRSGRAATSPAESRAWLEASLFADQLEPIRHLRVSAGQFDPGRAGGILSSPLEVLDKEGFVNPWDFVLGLEGALLFASAASRRLEATAGRPSVPFMVAASPVGYGSSAAEESSKGELWAPLWRRPAGLAELARLIGEGRAEWRGRQAARGLDVARAATNLGVDRGVHSFVRHVFVERHGQNMLSVPVGRIEVRERPGVALLVPVDTWLARARQGASIPAAVAGAIRAVDAAMYEASAADSDTTRMQAVLIALASAEAAVGRSTGHRERSGARPIGNLPALDWLAAVDDDTPELRLAAALASGRDTDRGCLRFLLRPIERGRAGWLEWTDRPARIPGFGTGGLAATIGAAHVRRMIDRTAAKRFEQEAEPDTSRENCVGVQTGFRWALSARMGDIAAFVAGEMDDDRMSRLLSGLFLLDFDEPRESQTPWTLDDNIETAVHPAWSVLSPFFQRTVASDNELVPEVTWPAQLMAGRVDDVVSLALRRLRIARRDPAVRSVRGSALAGARLTAALLIPMPVNQARAVLDRTAPRVAVAHHH